MDIFKLGQITSPVGIKGEMRVYPYLDDMTRFSAVEKVLIDGENEYRTVEKFRVDKNLAVMKLSGIDDRNASELYRGRFIVLPKSEMPSLPENTYYSDELIGMDVVDENGVLLGALEDINQNSKQDLYVVNTGEKSFMIPAVAEFILSVDTENKKMTVHLIDGLADL